MVAHLRRRGRRAKRWTQAIIDTALLVSTGRALRVIS